MHNRKHIYESYLPPRWLNTNKIHKHENELVFNVSVSRLHDYRMNENDFHT